MSAYQADLPELVPVLSRGKHRSPRRGACFMEMASFLAGERWSDRPACTHPLLAALARDVNDYTSDAARGRLAELIPSVIGLTGDDLRLDARIALVCARTALPVVAASRQQVLAVSILVCERVLARLDGRPVSSNGRSVSPNGRTASSDGRSVGWLTEPSQAALARVPHAAQWACDFSSDLPVTGQAFRRRAAPFTVHVAAEGIADACIPQPDDMLRDLLIAAIGECAAWAGRDAAPGPSAAPGRGRSIPEAAAAREPADTAP